MMTNSGDFFGIPATGRRVTATGQFIREITDGKVSAEWQTTDAAGIIKQLKQYFPYTTSAIFPARDMEME